MTNSPPISESLPFIPHLLVVDDDARLRSLLARYLAEQGWLITCAHHAEDARTKMGYFHFDLMILDVMMPNETGIEFAKALKHPHPPILMLTAMNDGNDRIVGLEAGADDYLAKPFEPRELVLRIQKLLHRTLPPHQDSGQELRFGAWHLDLDARRLSQHDTPVHLTESEMNLLMMLAEHANQTVSREQLLLTITSPGEEPNPRSTDVLMTRLRKKIETEPSKPVYLQTVRGEGYALRT